MAPDSLDMLGQSRPMPVMACKVLRVIFEDGMLRLQLTEPLP